MAMPIISRPVRGRLYSQAADARGADTPPPPQQELPPLRRCGDCQLDLGRDVLRALCACPRWGMQRFGVECGCPAFVAKGGAQ
ncbi:hypothetical protein GCM10011487_69670 [Steroidobacter agaridevorans]|uniref:Uncharacterized protein n=1 Tax=Steroidobacter agaridevorans TaxID=2695856 RepID=A0A829YNP7_9GAMM|nr:hypothetical protein GCM10011487_69670 [Steroidobacter agaridevorans]